MLNQVVLVGRLTKDIEDEIMTLAVSRSFKNADGEYETDFIPVGLFTAIKDNVKEYCRKGDIVGIKGRLELKENQLIVVAEKVTFLSSRKDKEEE